MTTPATGTFDVDLTPLPPDATGVSRMLIAKRFRGDLVAESTGQMLAHRSAVAGSAGYVAMERVTGRLHGREGTFVLQHTGTMARGEPGLTVAVVPDSGTGELAGLSGTMEIVAGDGHSYVFAYALTAGG